MRILSVTGSAHGIINNYSRPGIEYVNRSGLMLSDVEMYMEKHGITFNSILITDEALPSDDYEICRHLQGVLNYIDRSGSLVKVIQITGNIHLQHFMNDIRCRFSGFDIYYFDGQRVPSALYETVLRTIDGAEIGTGAHGKYNEKAIDADVHETAEKKARKPSFLDRFKKKKPDSVEARDGISRELDRISQGTSRVIAISGHRGSGITSTVVNTAYEASNRGLKTIIVDLDIEYRGLNIYLNQFSDGAEKDQDLAASLIGMLAKPQDYKVNAVSINENLWASSLAYQFKDRMLLEKFYTTNRIIGMITVLKQHFNLVILDMPLDLFGQFREALLFIDVFGLCVPNNLYAVLSTLRNLDIVLNREDAAYLNSKALVIATKFNDRSIFQEDLFTLEKLCELMTSDIIELFQSEILPGGAVPYSHEFDAQIESGVLASQKDAVFKRAYGSILLRLMGGGK